MTGPAPDWRRRGRHRNPANAAPVPPPPRRGPIPVSPAPAGPGPLRPLPAPTPAGSAEPDGTAPDEPADLGKKVASATRWSLANTLVIRIGTFATGIVLARFLLGPREWGLYAVGMVVLSVLLSANEMGVSLALVRWPGNVRTFAPTVMTLSTAGSLLLYAALYISAPTVAGMLGSSDASTLLRVLCLAVVIDGVACVPAGVLTRNFAQGKRMLIDLANFIVSTGLTVGLAAAGFGAISFAWGAVAGNTIALIGAAIAAPGFLRFGWRPDQARALLRFGLPLAGASLLVLAMLNVDSAVVGHTLGASALGLYQIAFNVSSWPVRSVSEAARRVSFAGFSRVASAPRALEDGFRRALTLLMTLAVPACVLLGVLARPVITTLYGAQWSSAAVPLQFLAALGLIRVAFELAYDCLGAAGRRKELIAVQGWWLAALIPALILLANRYGVAGVGAGHVLVAGILVAPAFLIALNRAGIRPRTVFRACRYPFAGGILAGAVALLVQRLLGENLLGLLAAGTAGLVAYAPVFLLVRHQIRTPAAGLAEPDQSTGLDNDATIRLPRVPGMELPSSDAATVRLPRLPGAAEAATVRLPRTAEAATVLLSRVPGDDDAPTIALPRLPGLNLAATRDDTESLPHSPLRVGLPYTRPPGEC